jgi:hypothetical protein
MLTPPSRETPKKAIKPKNGGAILIFIVPKDSWGYAPRCSGDALVIPTTRVYPLFKDVNGSVPCRRHRRKGNGPLDPIPQFVYLAT